MRRYVWVLVVAILAAIAGVWLALERVGPRLSVAQEDAAAAAELEPFEQLKKPAESSWWDKVKGVFR